MYHKTVNEMLEAWDSGDSIWTIEMGGLGPGYEQAIQVMMVEFCRAGQDFKWPEKAEGESDEQFQKRWVDEKVSDRFGDLCDAALKPIDKQLGGVTGAMYGAAKSIAAQFLRFGPAKALENAKAQGIEDRLILVSSFMPQVLNREEANAKAVGS